MEKEKVYEVLARKWRPQKFAEVVGQEHITRTLTNAILQQRVGHAYLFVGPRGTGKTTTARIFAKALNCTNRSPEGEPCCQCTSCLQIASGNSMDVLEIDGASHNKADDMRDLRESVNYRPTTGDKGYRIYIIDEVHMLSNSAWNALLKTLEEPPPHVKFLFATTEPHKVLATIISRCQRFDLKPIPVPLIVQQLKKIIAPENIHIEDAALEAIARAAEGGMRDAQSILDQIIAFCDGHSSETPIREQDVIDVFGLASSQELQIIVSSLLGNNQDSLFGIIQQLSDKGRDLERLYEEILSYVRNLIICRLTKEPQNILQIEDMELANLQKIASIAKPSVLQRILQGLVENANGIRVALNKRVYLEATLSRIAFEANSLQIEDLIARLNELRQQNDLPVIPSPPTPPPAQIIIQNFTSGTVAEKTSEAVPVSVNDGVQEISISEDVKKKSETITEELNPKSLSIPTTESVKAPLFLEPVPEESEPFGEIPEVFLKPAPEVAYQDPFAQVEEVAESNYNSVDNQEVKIENSITETNNLEANNTIEEIRVDDVVFQEEVSSYSSNQTPISEKNGDDGEELEMAELIFKFKEAEKVWRYLLTELHQHLSVQDYNKLLTLQPINMLNDCLCVGYEEEQQGEELLGIFNSETVQQIMLKALKAYDANREIQTQCIFLPKDQLKTNWTSSKEMMERIAQTPQVKMVGEVLDATLIEVKGMI